MEITNFMKVLDVHISYNEHIYIYHPANFS
jgi:hypothetical protein